MMRAVGRLERSTLALCAILLAALALRVHSVGFGLPALYDPDEPIFIISALRLLGQKTLDPGWFGHPGTTTIYALALIDVGTLLLGLLTGTFRNVADFGTAVYLDPTTVVLPGRLFIVGCGIACVFLTWLIGRELFGERVGLIAAALLAFNPLHVEYSQLIRTDVHATVFMLLVICASFRIIRRGRLRDYVTAGILIGLATATKWPAATIALSPIGAGVLRAIEHPEEAPRQLANMIAMACVAGVSLILVSPYLLIDHQRLLEGLHGESQHSHLGATGGGFAENLGWYIVEPMRISVGWIGMVFAGFGIAIGGLRSRQFLATCMPGGLAFLLSISVQALIWPRWIVPLLPFLSLAIAIAVSALIDVIARSRGRRLSAAVGTVVILLIAWPMAADVRAQDVERLHDTRALASGWLERHVPAGQTILVEHFAFDLLRGRWTILFPGGVAGCIDATRTLKGRIQSSTADRWRSGRAIVSIGTIDPTRLESCRTDFAVFSYYDRYRTARGFDQERALYRRFIANGTITATFSPQPGRIGGPVVEIVRLNRAPGRFLAGEPSASQSASPAPNVTDTPRSGQP